ncbi:hypothetical protein N7466_009631 [Penicillium verhagenii]|uniref:uncharacterized protein n=1 Tax=Penicillium verhagenii TaxID=1562060 RepID=UPI002545BC3A|nr:uncharacterized protein N7466_009631 [Penicillium verhagenii]KAJ5921305.1 hypothetical protein N7466_009631 [Penicillium verhagenii]
MAGNRMRRIGKELADIHADTKSQITAAPVNEQEDITHLRGSFLGPPGTPYEGGTYTIDIKIPTDYPFPTTSHEVRDQSLASQCQQSDSKQSRHKPFIVSRPQLLLTMYLQGAICLDTLSSAWSPVLTIKSALLSLQSLLSTPEPKDPQDAEVANMMMRTPKEFDRVARQWATIYAGAPSSVNDNATGQDETEVSDHNSLAHYDGYNKELIDRFGSMGFDVARVVSAFQDVGIDRNGGLDRELSDGQMADVTNRLLGE